MLMVGVMYREFIEQTNGIVADKEYKLTIKQPYRVIKKIFSILFICVWRKHIAIIAAKASIANTTLTQKKITAIFSATVPNVKIDSLIYSPNKKFFMMAIRGFFSL